MSYFWLALRDCLENLDASIIQSDVVNMTQGLLITCGLLDPNLFVIGGVRESLKSRLYQIIELIFWTLETIKEHTCKTIKVLQNIRLLI